MRLTMRLNIRSIPCGYLIFYMLIGAVTFVSSAKNEVVSCDENSTQDCLEKLQTFLKLKSLAFTSKEAELNKLCSNTIAGYNCSATKSTIPNCLSDRDKDLFPVFIQMAQYVMYRICISEGGNSGDLKEDFLKNSECILKQKEALHCCAEGVKLSNFPVMYVLEHSSKSIKERQMEACCPIANYLKCALPIVEKNCGKEAANLTVTYVRIASGEPLEMMCQKMPDYPDLEPDICEVPPAVCSGSRIYSTLLELIALMCISMLIKSTSYM